MAKKIRFFSRKFVLKPRQDDKITAIASDLKIHDSSHGGDEGGNVAKWSELGIWMRKTRVRILNEFVFGNLRGKL